MQPLAPVLLNPSAAASAADPQTLISCRGVEETFCHVRFWACFPSGTSAVDSFLTLAAFFDSPCTRS